MRIFACQINPIVGDLDYNLKKILEKIAFAKKGGADVVLFPELALCGYPPEDLLLFPHFIKKMEGCLDAIAKATSGLFVVVGFVRKNPKSVGKLLFNSAAVFIDGKCVGFKDKTLLPTYTVFDESRYFEPGEKQKVWEYKKKKIGIFICEDVWQHSGLVGYTRYHRDPVKEIEELKPDLLLNLSASPYYFQKKNIRLNVFSKATSFLQAPMVLCNQVGANDQLVFDGYSLYFNAKGELLQLAKGFEEDTLVVDTEHPSAVCLCEDDPIRDLYKALVLGVRDYFAKQGFKKACLGLSGGIDSALSACIAVDAIGKENVLAFSMPSRYSSLSSMEDAQLLSERLGIERMDIPIDGLFQKFLDTLSGVFLGRPADTTEENLQARIRGMILMAISNKLGYIVLSTGNKSEMAMGYTTLYGDMAGGLAVIGDVPKTWIYKLAHFVNRKEEIIPLSTMQKPPSAELRPDQTDQDTLPPYDLLDIVLSEYVEEHLSGEEIAKKHQMDLPMVKELIRKIHLSEYKRRQGPPSICVTKRAFTKGRVLPIVQGFVR
jgi:NAD+ synthase (glutamine-hydrolysing)